MSRSRDINSPRIKNNQAIRTRRTRGSYMYVFIPGSVAIQEGPRRSKRHAAADNRARSARTSRNVMYRSRNCCYGEILVHSGPDEDRLLVNMWTYSTLGAGVGRNIGHASRRMSEEECFGCGRDISWPTECRLELARDSSWIPTEIRMNCSPSEEPGILR